jgi:hypothetical protein
LDASASDHVAVLTWMLSETNSLSGSK